MWVLLNDAYLSIVQKDCPLGHLLVRARREGDIEKVFGRRTKVTRTTDADYLFRAVVPKDEVSRALSDEVHRIDYDNFKNSVDDKDLHDAYSRVWTTLASLQNPRPYSQPYSGKALPMWTAWGPENIVPLTKEESVRAKALVGSMKPSKKAIKDAKAAAKAKRKNRVGIEKV